MGWINEIKKCQKSRDTVITVVEMSPTNLFFEPALGCVHCHLKSINSIHVTFLKDQDEQLYRIFLTLAGTTDSFPVVE